jgi:hypothetical protein
MFILEEGLFHEDHESDTQSLIKKYFSDVSIINKDTIHLRNLPSDYTGLFRGSLALATKLNRIKNFTNALEWAPILREFLASEYFLFLDAKGILQHNLNWPLFIRPTAGNKSFSGNVYTREKFKIEYDYLTVNKNYSPSTLCMFASPVEIFTEWRCIFINNEYCSGSQYMQNGELSVNSNVPEYVIEFANKIISHEFFLNLFEFVLDIGLTNDGLKVIEVNGFETSSFYGADLDKIYQTWSVYCG